MNPEIDRLLSREPTIEPHPRFVDRVMQRVWREHFTPPPIPFPWKLFAVGAISGIAAIGTALANRSEGSSAIPTGITEMLTSTQAGGIGIAVASVAGSLLIAWMVIGLADNSNSI